MKCKWFTALFFLCVLFFFDVATSKRSFTVWGRFLIFWPYCFIRSPFNNFVVKDADLVLVEFHAQLIFFPLSRKLQLFYFVFFHLISTKFHFRDLNLIENQRRTLFGPTGKQFGWFFVLISKFWPRFATKNWISLNFRKIWSFFEMFCFGSLRTGQIFFFPQSDCQCHIQFNSPVPNEVKI